MCQLILFFFFKALLFSEEKMVFFTVKLRRRYRDFPYIPCLHMCVVLPIINLPHPSGTCVTVDDVTLIHHHPPKVHSLHEGFLLGVIHSMIWTNV